jgi:epsilon-lactone hydrolase
MDRQKIRYLRAPRGARPASPAMLARREAMDAETVVLPDEIVIEREISGPGNAEWVKPARDSGVATILFLHGSGYSKGSPASHRGLVARLVDATKAIAFVPDYRLAPEHPFPAALEDALSSYRFLLERVGRENIVCVGDSAGGGLVLATLLAAQEEGLPMPAAAITLSAWTDLAVTAPSARSGAVDDPIVTAAMLLEAADLYLDGADPYCHYASALYGDPAQLPPLLMQVGSREVMIDDTLRFAEKARAAGVDVVAEVFAGMTHVFQLKQPDHPQTRRAIELVGQFIRQHAAVESKVLGSSRAHATGCHR